MVRLLAIIIAPFVLIWTVIIEAWSGIKSPADWIDRNLERWIFQPVMRFFDCIGRGIIWLGRLVKRLLGPVARAFLAIKNKLNDLWTPIESFLRRAVLRVRYWLIAWKDWLGRITRPPRRFLRRLLAPVLRFFSRVGSLALRVARLIYRPMARAIRHALATTLKFSRRVVARAVTDSRRAVDRAKQMVRLGR
jgi:hypothetical protein